MDTLETSAVAVPAGATEKPSVDFFTTAFAKDERRRVTGLVERILTAAPGARLRLRCQPDVLCQT
jgi:hypothetical protein